MKLEDIGFYSLSDERARIADHTTQLTRCELLLTSRCNFRCPYCMPLPDSPYTAALAEAWDVIVYWLSQRLRFLRLSGGEPTLLPYLADLVARTRVAGMHCLERVAISTNGSAPWAIYENLLSAGVDDFSVSLDGCCAASVNEANGGCGQFERICENIRRLAARSYVTAGVVYTSGNENQLSETITFASGLGVQDIRVIPAAQHTNKLIGVQPVSEVTPPILKYRLNNMRAGRTVRGLRPTDAPMCRLALDDMAVWGRNHYPCIIYLRQGGNSIGRIGETTREDRAAWVAQHNPHADPICLTNCLDVCRDYNRRAFETYRVLS